MRELLSVRTIILAISLLSQLGTLCVQAHGAAGDVDLSFDPGSGVNGSVTVVVLQPDGKVIIGGGGFTMVRGLLRANLARLHSDGSGDATFDAGSTMSGLTGSPLTALALQPDGRLLVAGAFDAAFCDENGCIQDYNGTVLRLNADGSRDQTFAAALADYSSVPREFRCLVPLPDGKILVGGDFININGTPRPGIARLHANGTLDASFSPDLNGAIHCVAAQPDGKVLITGSFTTIGGTPRNGVARLNANGSLDPAFDAGFVSVRFPGCGPEFSCSEYTTIAALALQPDGKLLVGVWKQLYQLPLAGGPNVISDHYSVKRLNPNGSNDPDFVFTNSAEIGVVGGFMVQPDGRVLVRHGTFNTSKIHRLHADGSWDGSFQFGNVSGSANAATLQPDGKIITGGFSLSANTRQRLSRLNGDGTRDPGFDSGRGLDSAPQVLALQPDGKVLLGGPLRLTTPWFAFVNGTSHHGRKRLNVDGSLDGGFVPTPFPTHFETRFHTEDCFGDPRYACVHGFEATGLAVQSNGKVLIGGTYVTNIVGDGVFWDIYHSFLGRFDAAGGLETEFNLPNTYVTAMAQQPDGRIVIAGSLVLNGTSCTVGRLHADGGVESSFQLGNGPPFASCLALQSDGRIVVGGTNAVVGLNADGSRDLSFTPAAISNGAVNTLVMQPDGKTLLAGEFTTVNGTSRHRIARLNADGSLDLTFHPGTGANGVVRSIALQPDGNVLLGGDFTAVNGAVRPYVARLHGGSTPPLFAAWALGHGLTGAFAAAEADPDHDGLPNSVEFILGGNPAAPAPFAFVRPTVAVSPDNMVFTFPRADASETPGLVLTVQAGSDLVAWPQAFTIGSSTTDSSPGVTISENGTAADTVTVTIPSRTATRLFARLSVAIVP